MPLRAHVIYPGGPRDCPWGPTSFPRGAHVIAPGDPRDIKITRRNIDHLRYADDTTLMAESKELKSLLMKVKEESEKVVLNATFRKLRLWHPVPSLHGK